MKRRTMKKAKDVGSKPLPKKQRTPVEHLLKRYERLVKQVHETQALVAEAKVLTSEMTQRAVRAEGQLVELKAQLEKLSAFKQYVHTRLDQAGVPSDPEPEQNAKHGCRIEGRLNWVEAALRPLGSAMTRPAELWCPQCKLLMAVLGNMYRCTCGFTISFGRAA